MFNSYLANVAIPTISSASKPPNAAMIAQALRWKGEGQASRIAEKPPSETCCAKLTMEPSIPLIMKHLPRGNTFFSKSKRSVRSVAEEVVP